MIFKIHRFVLFFISVYMVTAPANSAPAGANGSSKGKNTASTNSDKSDASSDGSSCQVSGIWYRHGQQIARKDPCDFCLCIDREMFCYWQPELCLPTPSFSNNASRILSSSATGANSTETFAVDHGSPETNASTGIPDSSPTTQTLQTTTQLSESTVELSTPQPTSCSVLGVEYKLGEILPRDTGSCLQCQCTYEARITCTPKNCVSLSQDYQHDISNSMDMFDVDVF